MKALIDWLGPKDLTLGYFYALGLNALLWTFAPEIPWHGRLFFCFGFLGVWYVAHIRMSDK